MGPGGRVLVLNASYEPISVCTVRQATVLSSWGARRSSRRASGGSRRERDAHPAGRDRLLTYVRIPRRHRREITRRAIFARDRWTCQYCGSSAAS